MERALLVTIKIDSEKETWHIEDIALELEALALTTGVEVVDNLICIREKPTPGLFIGKGKAEEIMMLAKEENIDTVIFSHDLSGTQQRNLDEALGIKTIDRTQLILDIFARHAKSQEGKTQVELAQLEYLLPRLVGKGVILSRLGGGIGTRGPGEQKLEVDRRRIRQRIAKLKGELAHLRMHRQTVRKQRKENAVATVAIVGYTSAGKSSLLNTLTGSTQVVSENLFTTLDPLAKNLKLPDGDEVVITDTVGFLHNLPHRLIEAFKATLEDVVDAHALIHVLDASHPRVYELSSSVKKVLEDIGAADKPVVVALNKIDLVQDPFWLSRLKKDFHNSVPISAKFQQNIPDLLDKIQENFKSRMQSIELLIPHTRMDLVDFFYRKAKVNDIKYDQKGIRIKVNINKNLSYKLLQDKDVKHIN